MRALQVVMLAWTGGIAIGCGGRAAPEDFSPPTDVAMVAAARQEILRSEPDAIVGYVTEVLPRERFAAVGDVPLDQFRVGQVVMFVDLRQKLLTHGVIRRITSAELHVQYQPPGRGGRAPRVGDLALRFTSPT